MSELRFPIGGTSVAPLIGREEILQKMESYLTKAVPDHLQVVGPRFAGKTVILHKLAASMRENNSHYSAVVLWDLGHQSPATDELFMRRLAEELASALKSLYPDYAKHLSDTTGNPYPEIAEVLDLLKEEGIKVLAIMDGFDRPLKNGELTRNLWDQLRELAIKPSLRLVTASRRTLSDLIRNPEAQTSDFWNIFNPTPLKVACFDDTDIASVLSTSPELQLEAGAKTELLNASNGFPVLTLGTLNSVFEMNPTPPITAEVMREAYKTAYPSLRDKIDALWLDSTSSSRDLVRRVKDEGHVARDGIAKLDIDTVTDCGFVRLASNRLQRPNRLLLQYLEEQPHEENSLIRLFGSQDTYTRHMKGVMELRVNQIEDIDPTLKHFLTRGSEDFPDHPDVFLTSIRGIVNRAFELIWTAELEGKSIPSSWISTWQYNKESRVDDFKTTFPQGVHRLRLLNLMTGTDRSNPYAKYVTKGTYVLMNGVHAFGDFGQHQEGVPVHTETAYSALHLCIELAAALARELPYQ